MAKKLTLALACLLLFISCSNSIDDSGDDFEKVIVTLSIKSSGAQFLDFEPLSKTTANDIVGIQIYQRTAVEGSKYKPFGYGLWDNSGAAVSVELNKGQIYKFEATIIPNGQQIVALNSTEGIYRQPFIVAGGGVGVFNELTYSAVNYFTNLSIGTTATITGKSYTLYNHPVADRYYGQKSEVVAMATTGVAIELNRPVFGLRYMLKNFTDGTLRVALKNAPDIVLTPQTTPETQTIITFQGTAADPLAWCGDEYAENIPLTVYWKPSSGSEVEILSENKLFKRMQYYSLNIDMATSASQGGVNLKLEQKDMSDGGDI